MANDLNNCQFIGRLGKDPEVKYLPSGDAVANFSVACGEQWKDKQGQKQERTEWVNCAAFGKLAEIIGEYLAKGSQVFISGKMKTEKYQAQDGSDRYSTKIIVRDMQMIGGKSDNGGQQQSKPKQAPAQQPQNTAQQMYGSQQPKPQAPAQQQAPQQNFTPNLDEGWDDDIPF
jgi:single-strand DNA-binding protein